MVVLDILLGLFLIIVMMVASGAAVEIFEKLVREVKIRKLLLATVLVGFSTSLPELFVGVESALRGHSQLALGDILGANIANMSWIIGGSAILSGAIPIVGEYIKKDLWITMTTAMVPLFLLLDGKLERWDGVVLVVAYLYYVWDVVKNGEKPTGRAHLTSKIHVVHHRLKTKVHWSVEAVKLVCFLSLLAGSSWMLINMALRIAGSLGVSYFWVGLLILAGGTTLPELIVSVAATKKKEVSLVLGNVFGSVVVNSTLILGIVALISPVTYEDRLSKGVAGVFLIAVLGLFWLFTKSKHKLEKWEGAVLVGVYAMFVGMQMMFA